MHRRVARQGQSVRVEEELWRGAGRRSLAAVIAGQGLGAGLPIEHEGAAADAGGLRFDQGEHHLGGDAGVDGRAPFAQHGKACFRGERVGGDHHVLLRLDEGLGRQAALALRHIEGERGRGQQQSRERGGKKGAQHAAQHRGFWRTCVFDTATHEASGFAPFDPSSEGDGAPKGANPCGSCSGGSTRAPHGAPHAHRPAGR